MVYLPRGGGLCNSMPSVWLGLTICVVKCSCFLVRHLIFKSNAPLLFRWLPSKLKRALGEVHSLETPLLCTLFYLKGPAPCCHWLSVAGLLYIPSLSCKAVLSAMLAILCYVCGYGIVCPSIRICRSIFI